MATEADWIKIRLEYETTGLAYRKLAAKHGVSFNTLKDKAKRESWVKGEKTPHHKSAPQKNVVSGTLPEKILTDKEQEFCLFYMGNFNATQAAIKAGYEVKSARWIGYELLTKPHIRAVIEQMKLIRRQSLMIGEDDIVERYMRIAFADMTDISEWGTVEVPVLDSAGMKILLPDGTIQTKKQNYMNFKNSDAVDGGLVCEVSLGKSGMKVKLEDRQKALDWLANFFGMNPEHKHRKWYDAERIKTEQQRTELMRQKLKSDTSLAEAVAASNERVLRLADLINNPVPDRPIEDFEDD